MEKLNDEEVFNAVSMAVRGMWSKYPSVRNEFEQEDVVQEIMLKFYEPKAHQGGKCFMEYMDPAKITGGNQHALIKNIVNRKFIDILRKQKDLVSMDKELMNGDGDESTLYNFLPSWDRFENEQALKDLLDKLPDEPVSTAVFKEPHFENGQIKLGAPGKLTYRTVAKLLAWGMDAKEITECCFNPTTRFEYITIESF